MKKSEALAVLNAKIEEKTICAENLLNREEIEKEIRIASVDDELFEQIVFELGCSILAKAYEKSRHK